MEIVGFVLEVAECLPDSWEMKTIRGMRTARQNRPALCAGWRDGPIAYPVLLPNEWVGDLKKRSLHAERAAGFGERSLAKPHV